MHLRLPRAWTMIVRSSTLHAISIATTALTAAWAGAARIRSPRQRQLAEISRLETEVALLEEELEIKDARWARMPARRWPHYSSVQRMRILKLRAARGWSLAQVAQRFLVAEETIASWIRRVDESGERALVQTEEPLTGAEGAGFRISKHWMLLAYGILVCFGSLSGLILALWATAPFDALEIPAPRGRAFQHGTEIPTVFTAMPLETRLWRQADPAAAYIGIVAGVVLGAILWQVTALAISRTLDPAPCSRARPTP